MINEKINRYENTTYHKSLTSQNVKLENQNRKDRSISFNTNLLILNSVKQSTWMGRSF